ncbi:Periplasmic DMSO/TMAO reductase YedYZ, molybdopterin-dependent catalytic subunit [Chelatococcus sambhunathii]|uniref:Mononuclear molybdenum enzyme YedY n=2 Tax=Chelatococcus TaxID=28209 RepID=A0AAC9NZ21_9HYPH|nr:MULTISPECIES: protein-methionine-sulfoxide reductase catalytic subunit MsrP [Chelatococcus]APF38134.1 mononuclear molybdenum enzyme YedY [Chelatococcus daeguensis]CUA84233.1 Periplasmic DMSO/TMAO reductase YedYZ, molybdopterin-dependent catalytic subunit [Chelatococcus sambhunathii]
MLIRTQPGWRLPESVATSEAIFFDRRSFLAGAAGLVMLGAGRTARAQEAAAGLYPAPRNERFVLDRSVTPEEINTAYNNFYEFGSHKRVAAGAEALVSDPWTIKVDGLVERPFEIGLDELLKTMPLEERLYRHRCVEAWAMAVPWTGFAFSAFVKRARPLGSAKYVVMQTFHDPKIAPGQRQTWYPWPYTEGLTIAEATNELAFLVTGAYGKPLPKVMGAPLRLAVPWKYGFKSIKSINRISFSETRPTSFWEALQPSEYGFWANVNPAVPHPRWSQAAEEMIGTGEMFPTQIYNGYGAFVAGLYSGLVGEKLFL